MKKTRVFTHHPNFKKEMDKISSVTMDKKVKFSKLVTVCSTNNDGFGPFFPPFEYIGSSRSENSKVKIAFPSYDENMCFYEHFENNMCNPSRLAFIYLGGNNDLEIDFDFQMYDQITAVDVSKTFLTVNSVFQVIDSLPSVREVKFYLSSDNLVPSVKELEKIEKKIHQVGYCNKTVTSLSILQDGIIQAERWNIPVSRLHYILRYAHKCFPNLAYLTVNLDANGHIYDLVNQFKKSLLITGHSLTIQEGKVICSPQPGLLTSKPLVVAKGVSSTQPQPIKSMNFPVKTLPRSPVLQDPRLKAELHKSIDHQGKEIQKKIIAEPEIVELKVPKMEPAVIDLVDDDEDLNVPLPFKKSKIEALSNVTVPPPTRSISSVDSRTSTSTCSTLVDRPASNNASIENSLSSIGSTYNEWEESSDDEDNHAHQPNPLIDPAKIDISKEDLLKILSSVKTTTSDRVPEANSKDSTKSKMKGSSRVKFKELEYERPNRNGVKK